MAQNSSTSVIGLIAMVLGALLMMGGSMFLLATSVMGGDLPGIIYAPPALQVGLGMAAVAGGFFMYRGHSAAKSVLVFVAVSFLANCVFLAWAMLEMAMG